MVLHPLFFCFSLHLSWPHVSMAAWGNESSPCSAPAAASHDQLLLPVKPACSDCREHHGLQGAGKSKQGCVKHSLLCESKIFTHYAFSHLYNYLHMKTHIQIHKHCWKRADALQRPDSITLVSYADQGTFTQMQWELPLLWNFKVTQTAPFWILFLPLMSSLSCFIEGSGCTRRENSNESPRE